MATDPGLNQMMTRHLQHIANMIADLAPPKAATWCSISAATTPPAQGVFERRDYPSSASIPAPSISALPISGQRRVGDGLFSAANYRNIMNDCKARVVISIMMFYDLQSPLRFVEGYQSDFGR